MAQSCSEAWNERAPRYSLAPAGSLCSTVPLCVPTGLPALPAPPLLSGSLSLSCFCYHVNLPVTSEFKNKTKPQTGSNWLPAAGMSGADLLPHCTPLPQAAQGQAPHKKGAIKSPGLFPVTQREINRTPSTVKTSLVFPEQHASVLSTVLGPHGTSSTPCQTESQSSSESPQGVL